MPRRNMAVDRWHSGQSVVVVVPAGRAREPVAQVSNYMVVNARYKELA